MNRNVWKSMEVKQLTCRPDTYVMFLKAAPQHEMFQDFLGQTAIPNNLAIICDYWRILGPLCDRLKLNYVYTYSERSRHINT